MGTFLGRGSKAKGDNSAAERSPGSQAESRSAYPEPPCVPQLLACPAGPMTLATCSWVRWHWAESTTSPSMSPA